MSQEDYDQEFKTIKTVATNNEFDSHIIDKILNKKTGEASQSLTVPSDQHREMGKEMV